MFICDLYTRVSYYFGIFAITEVFMKCFLSSNIVLYNLFGFWAVGNNPQNNNTHYSGIVYAHIVQN